MEAKGEARELLQKEGGEFCWQIFFIDQ